MIDWTGYGVLPAHTWCFVELSNLPKGNAELSYGGIGLRDGVYAVVESAEYAAVETTSELFIPLDVEVGDLRPNGSRSRSFYLANTEAFVGPCCVIPDIGNNENRYLQVVPRGEWSDLFIQWLLRPHKENNEDYSDEEEECIHPKSNQHRRKSNSSGEKM